MNYKEALNYIENTGKFGMNLGLERIKKLCELIGNPEKDLKIIHVAGTNGKGSTSTFISSILASQGYRVGLYTSPYIERFTERIKINNNEIVEDEIARLVTEIEPKIHEIEKMGMEHPTEFEIITACAFKYFKEKEVDFVVLEVGLGGRFDATNIINPIVSVITSISYDHVNILGDTLSKIAYEKAGIIKNGRPVVIYPQDKEAEEVLVGVAKEKEASIYLIDGLKHEILSNTVDGIIFNASLKKEYKDLKIELLGEYQVLNAVTAITAIEVIRNEGYKIDDGAIYSGLITARWPGRLEILNKKPYVVLDGAHNIQGIKGLVNALKHYFPKNKINIVCGMLKDKDYNCMLKELIKVSDYFITVEPNSPRALSALELKNAIMESGGSKVKVMDSKNIMEAVSTSLKSCKDGDVLVFCGSLYMIGEARKILKTIY